MSKNLSAAAFAVFLVLTVALGCSFIPDLRMSTDKAAESLMTALRDGDYVRAVGILENDDKPSAKYIESLKKKIESENLQPQSWTLEVTSVYKSNNKSYEIVTGNVIFKDGSSGTMRAEVHARGLTKHFSGFELKR